jgi:hypothetical protein
MTAAMLLVSAALAVLYISNAIAVNNIMSQIASLEREGDIVRVENERLRADLLRLMSVERVTSMASGQLGMVQPAHPPVSLPVAGAGAADEGVRTNQKETREQPAGR